MMILKSESKNVKSATNFQPQVAELIMSHEISARPWEKLVVDYFTLFNQNYLININKYISVLSCMHVYLNVVDIIIKLYAFLFAKSLTTIENASNGFVTSCGVPKPKTTKHFSS